MRARGGFGLTMTCASHSVAVLANPGFEPIALPVTREHLRTEGLGPAFVDYMQNWKGFVAA